MASIDPNLMIILEDIRQEVEDMAYNKLRTVISDFSLEGPELNKKIEKHKQSIKVKFWRKNINPLSRLTIIFTFFTGRSKRNSEKKIEREGHSDD